MKRVIQCLFFSVLFIAAGPVYATPPREINLDFDLEKGVLSIEMLHVSHDRNGHYIRKVVILRNGKEIKSIHNRQQVDPSHFLLEVSMEAVVGDTIEIKALCAGGGSKTAQMKVEEKEEKMEQGSREIEKDLLQLKSETSEYEYP